MDDVALSRVSSQLLKGVRAGFTHGQLMDDVALSRVSSQLLKGVRAGFTLGQLMDVVALSRVSSQLLERVGVSLPTWVLLLICFNLLLLFAINIYGII